MHPARWWTWLSQGSNRDWLRTGCQHRPGYGRREQTASRLAVRQATTLRCKRWRDLQILRLMRTTKHRNTTRGIRSTLPLPSSALCGERGRSRRSTSTLFSDYTFSADKYFRRGAVNFSFTVGLMQ